MDWDGRMARLRALAFRGMNVLRAEDARDWAFPPGLFGNGFAVTAETLSQVPFSANSIAEDVEYHTKLACEGVRVYWVGRCICPRAPGRLGAGAGDQEGRWEGGRFKVGSRATGRLMSGGIAAENGAPWRRWPTFGASRFRAAFLPCC